MATRHGRHNPNPGPPQHGGGGGQGNGGGGNQNTLKDRHRRWLGQAESAIQSALVNRGVDPGMAIRYAESILSHKGVSVGKNEVKFNGRTFQPAAFASSGLADLLTGLTAQKENQSALTSDPGYLQSMAELGLQRDSTQAGYDTQRRDALLNFGDPRFTNDPLLAAESASNPFSLQAALSQQDAARQQAAADAANRSGTLFGGGAVSGQAEAQRENAAAQTSATQSLQQLLAGLGQQSGDLQSAYGVGQQRALLDTQQRLLASGQIHAAVPPPIQIGQFHYMPLHVKGGGGQGGGGGGGGGGGHHRPLPIPTGFPIPPTRPPRRRQPMMGAG